MRRFGRIFFEVVKFRTMWYNSFMNLKVSAAIAACKLSRRMIRLLGRGGTDLPGRIALKIEPNLLGYLAKGVTTLIVTGTNGKTTTSRMIEQSWLDAGISFFANRSGANLLSGVTAEFADHCSVGGKCRCDHALIEADEAAFKYIAKYVDPAAIVVTNVFRDQLDRYGEVTHTLDNIRKGIENSPNARLALNADDSLCSSLKRSVLKPVLFYGVNVPVYESRVAELSDAPYCIYCKHEYVYDYVTYGHLGSYRCPCCGYQRPLPQITVSDVGECGAEHSEVTFALGDKTIPAVINLPGAYNIYNACACMAAGELLGLDASAVAHSLQTFSCGFGRMEKFRIHDADVRMILIKNPAGCNQVLNFLSQQTKPFVFTVCLNDRVQDGRDVSWIWDVDFEKIASQQDKLSEIYVSGIRAEDMAVRFRYAGFPPEKIHVQKSYHRLMEEASSHGLPVFVMPTYTALIDLRGTLCKQYGLKNFWE